MREYILFNFINLQTDSKNGIAISHVKALKEIIEIHIELGKHKEKLS